MDYLNRGKSYEHNGICHIEFCDDYEHIDDTIEYSVENILQSTNTNSVSFRTLYEQFNAFIAIKCDCDGQNRCAHSDCMHGDNYIVFENQQNQRELILNKHRRSHDVIYECSKFCLCNPNCHNRLVQFGPRQNLQIKDYSQFGKQYGLTTLQTIPQGAFICEYAGEILTKEEATMRTLLNDKNQKMNYIICLNEKPIGCQANGIHETIQTFIDPSRFGNIGRYLNHSCDPNCEIISVRIDGLIPKLAIFAKKSIATNEELCFDYGEDENKLTASPDSINRKPCYCGSERCRKFLPNL
ncbi:probable histone-lysine N-methyltransferase set-23 [Contarinia nasturtii]|uniref:probable histone-lysine N-methyltransferase set-23 n=1 Tax=Contarinia nasturtii TaxID=265458 RepID=UPI0012D4957D|nr:probable histone-lysine N-methyltransferase set-23 [Contarinia nasturtii]